MFCGSHSISLSIAGIESDGLDTGLLKPLAEGNLEYKGRTDEESQLVPQSDIFDFISAKLATQAG